MRRRALGEHALSPPSPPRPFDPLRAQVGHTIPGGRAGVEQPPEGVMRDTGGFEIARHVCDHHGFGESGYKRLARGRKSAYCNTAVW